MSSHDSRPRPYANVQQLQSNESGAQVSFAYLCAAGGFRPYRVKREGVEVSLARMWMVLRERDFLN